MVPALTVICTWTLPKRVWTTSPSYVPPALVAAPAEPVVPEVPVPEESDVSSSEEDPAALPVDAAATTLRVSATCTPDCHPARRIPADARAAETAALALTSRTFRNGADLRG